MLFIIWKVRKTQQQMKYCLKNPQHLWSPLCASISSVTVLRRTKDRAPLTPQNDNIDLNIDSLYRMSRERIIKECLQHKWVESTLFRWNVRAKQHSQCQEKYSPPLIDFSVFFCFLFSLCFDWMFQTFVLGGTNCQLCLRAFSWSIRRRIRAIVNKRKKYFGVNFSLNRPQKFWVIFSRKKTREFSDVNK